MLKTQRLEKKDKNDKKKIVRVLRELQERNEDDKSRATKKTMKKKQEKMKKKQEKQEKQEQVATRGLVHKTVQEDKTANNNPTLFFPCSLEKRVCQLERALRRLKPVCDGMKHIGKIKCGPRGRRGARGPRGPPGGEITCSLVRLNRAPQTFMAGKSKFGFPTGTNNVQCGPYLLRYDASNEFFQTGGQGNFRLLLQLNVDQGGDFFISVEVANSQGTVQSTVRTLEFERRMRTNSATLDITTSADTGGHFTVYMNTRVTKVLLNATITVTPVNS